MVRRVLTLFLFAPLVRAFLPGKSSVEHQSVLQDDSNEPRGPSVAVIGGGIAGTVALYTLFEKNQYEYFTPRLTLFEREPVIGGRIATTYAPQQPNLGFEAGAPGFNVQHACVANAARAVGLPLQALPTDPYKRRTGLWNGSQLYDLNQNDWYPLNWYQYSRGLYNFGRSFIALKKSVDATFSKFQLISPGFKEFRNLSRTWARTGLELEATTSAHTYFQSLIGADSNLLREVIEPTIRARLFAGTRDVSALAALLALIPDSMQKIDRANWQLPNRLRLLSEAESLTDARVTKLEQATTGAWCITSENSNGTKQSLLFDHVIFATNIRDSNISVQLADTTSLRDLIPSQSQQATARHVTYFASEARLHPHAFALPENSSTPDTIQTTAEGQGLFGLFSFETPSRITLPSDSVAFYYRTVSAKELPDTEIARLFNRQLLPGMGLSEVGIEAVKRRVWPYTVRLYEPTVRPLEDIQIAPGLYYAAAADGVVDSLEMSCLMGKNTALYLQTDRLWKFREPDF